MPIGYLRDDERKRVVVTLDGFVQPLQISSIVDRLVAERAWCYSRLCDMGRQVDLSGVAALQVLLSYVPRDISPDARRGPVAIVAADPAVYSKARALAALGGPTLMIEIFRDRETADQWLADNETP